MTFRLLQLTDDHGRRSVAASDGETTHLVEGVETTYGLALQAIETGTTLAETVARLGRGAVIDPHEALAAGRILAPIDHPDPAHLHMTGTGLTHLGSAEGRDKMHAKTVDDAKQTDSMRMFRMGLEGGKPADGAEGVQPEWFYKGDGTALVGPGAPLTSPAFALDGSEEPELAAIYVNGPDGMPHRLGFALANEFSDHVTERQNYLWLAHSKLRPAALGPEILVGELPEDVRGTSRVTRDGVVIWQGAFLTGEANMSHFIANLEHHHFKYAQFRRPGDVHVHFFGTATLSFSDGIATAPGDVFEISAAPFALPLVNPLRVAPPVETRVRAL
ncbi:AraD1 family protein [Amorphus sp. MBR-141]